MSGRDLTSTRTPDMIASWSLFIALLATIGATPPVEVLASSPLCADVPGRSFRIVVQGKKNESGIWETRFEAQHDQPDESDATRLEVKHSVLDCDGRQILKISGVFTDSSKAKTSPLRFHQNCGTNIAITSNGRKVLKINAEDRYNAVSLTNRPLKPNEIFEVRLDKKVNKHGYFMGIGLTTLSPDRDPIPEHLIRFKGWTWMFYHNHIFINGTIVINAYTRSLDQTQEGDRIGVMRSELGTLHYFHNGVDLGLAASNLPPNLYGGLELYGDMAQMTVTS